MLPFLTRKGKGLCFVFANPAHLCRLSHLVQGKARNKCISLTMRHVQSAVANVEKHLSTQGLKLPNKAATPFVTNYRPEIDISPELGTTDAAYFQSLIGILRWIVELGRIDITCEVSMMASMVVLPRKGHLKALYHIFAYL